MTTGEPPSFRRIGLLGAGLIGGSLAKAIRSARPGVEIVVGDPDDATRASALDEGVADSAFDPAQTPPETAFAGFDLLLLCAPPRVVMAALPRLAETDIALIADVASVKGPILDAARAAGLRNFLGGHPMAGTEASSWRAADPALFRGAAFILCEPPECRVPPPWLEAFRALLQEIGFRLFAMDAATHDRRLALISHLPHVAAFALAADAADAADPALAALFGGGFRDTTRIAASSPALWTDILRGSPALPAALDHHIATLRAFREALDPGADSGALPAILERAAAYRRTIPDGLHTRAGDAVFSGVDNNASAAASTADGSINATHS